MNRVKTVFLHNLYPTLESKYPSRHETGSHLTPWIRPIFFCVFIRTIAKPSPTTLLAFESPHFRCLWQFHRSKDKPRAGRLWRSAG